MLDLTLEFRLTDCLAVNVNFEKEFEGKKEVSLRDKNKWIKSLTCLNIDNYQKNSKNG